MQSLSSRHAKMLRKATVRKHCNGSGLSCVHSTQDGTVSQIYHGEHSQSLIITAACVHVSYIDAVCYTRMCWQQHSTRYLVWLSSRELH
jgi:hypothetical protein